MSGHSKWSTIKHKKGQQDQRRGALFTKLSREITVAARSGDSDPEMNFRLRLAVDNAKSNNMPKDSIERAIARANKGGNENQLQEITYEAYAPGGAGIIVQALTDNHRRVAAEVRSKITRGGGSMTSNGSVSWNFEAKGHLTLNVQSDQAEDLALELVDAGAEDVNVDGSTVNAVTPYDGLAKLRSAASKIEGVDVEMADIVLEPNSLVELNEVDARRTLRILDDLESLEDVQKVFVNADFPEKVLENYDA